MARDECISAVHDAFTRDGKVAQPVDVVTRSRVVRRPRVFRQTADARTEVHRIWWWWRGDKEEENKELEIIYDQTERKENTPGKHIQHVVRLEREKV